MAEPRSPAGRAAAAATASRAPGAPEAGPVAGGPALGASATTATGAAGGSTDAANLAAGEADAARIADRGGPADALRTGSLAEAAAAFVDREIPLPDGGPGIGAARVAERGPAQFTSRPIGTVGEEIARAELREPRLPGVTKDVLPRSEFRVDPDTVPGRRYATAAAQLRRDGLTYQPGEEVPVDYRAYSELVPVAGILADPWHRLPDAPEPEAPKVPPMPDSATKV